MTVWVVSQISRSMSSTERAKALFPSGKNKAGATNNVLPTFELTQLKDKEKQALFYLVSGHDVFVNVSTGFGKSLIHQPAPFVVKEMCLKKEGKSRSAIVLVISPLISLIKD